MQHLERGSAWRKWDLHIHVPETNGTEYSKEKPRDPWTPFLKLIENSGIEVFGITDYFSIEGYLLFMAKAKNNQKLESKKYYPNIEFRIDKNINKAGEDVNIHVIFDNSEKTIKQIQRFLSKVKLITPDKNQPAKYCDPDTIKEVGYDVAVVSLDDLQENLKSHFFDKEYIIAGQGTGYGSMMAYSESGRKKNLADTIEENCDVIFGNKEKTREFYLKTNRLEDASRLAVAKPTFNASDCHSFKDCDKNLGNEISWIKADTTFEGLRQTLYEPKDRVHIGQNHTDNRMPYHTIKEVRFSGGKESIFMPDCIPMSPYLTTIIGGKSTGKTILLYHIANTIDSDVTDKAYRDSKPYRQEDGSPIGFEVIWNDGTKSSTIENINDSVNNSKKILYIPQGYLSKLSEKNAADRDALNEFTTDIMLQDKEKKYKYDEHQASINILKKALSEEIINFFHGRQLIDKTEKEMKKLGEAKTIEDYIFQVKKDIDSMNKQAGIPKETSERYQALMDEGKKQSTLVNSFENDLKLIKDFYNYLVRKNKEVESEYENIKSGISHEKSNNLFANLLDTYYSSHEKLMKDYGPIVKELEEIICKENKILDDLRKQISPIVKEIKKHKKIMDDLDIKTKKIQEEEKKLDELRGHRNNIDALKKRVHGSKNRIIELYTGIFNSYTSVASDFNRELDTQDDISIKYQVTLYGDKFNEDVIGEFMNKSDIKNYIGDHKSNEEYYYTFEKEKHVEYINKIFEGLLEYKIRPIKNRFVQEAVTALFGDYFMLSSDIKYKNDKFESMSPGKKGIAMLKILLQLNDEEWPVLLDQPEDDLDNRSIYDELVDAIKQKKIKRQIIIVTHNPNLVLGADAELIIIANQAGQELDKDNIKYQFEYKSGAIENNRYSAKSKAILQRKNVREHVCEILEGGEEAFKKREKKYHLSRV